MKKLKTSTITAVTIIFLAIFNLFNGSDNVLPGNIFFISIYMGMICCTVLEWDEDKKAEKKKRDQEEL